MDILWWVIGGELIEFKLVLGVAAVLAALWFFRGTPYGLGIAAGVAALLGANYLAARGYKAAEEKHQKVANKAIAKARTARAKVDRLSDDDIFKDDGFRRD